MDRSASAHCRRVRQSTKQRCGKKYPDENDETRPRTKWLISRTELADDRRRPCWEFSAMKILVAHNFYKQPGGEDQCVADEVAMLRAHGHEVTQYCLRNESIESMSRLRLASRTIWSRTAFRELRELFRTHRPQIAHFHNTFPLISPAAYYAARAENVRVVQTVHNFRLCCANAVLFRDGKVCEACLGKSFGWPGIVHKCYHDSRAASAAIATMVATHRVLGTWQKAVDAY